MFGLFKPEAVSHYEDGGRIYCAERKTDVDVDYCLGCSRLVEARQDKGSLVIRCTGSAPVFGNLD